MIDNKDVAITENGPVNQQLLPGESTDDSSDSTESRPPLQSKSPDQWSEQAKLPIHLSRSTGGVSNTQLKAWTPKFHELCEDLQQRPEVAEKDGSYFLRGPFIEGQSIRADANIEYGSVIVLDGDSSFDPETGEVSEGAPSPESVHQVLVELGISHVIYSSHSNGQPGKGHRFRVLLPAHCKDAGELKGYHRWIFHRLNEHGCWLVDVKENGAWSQPWYFPRRANNDSEYQFFCHDSGKPFDTTAALEWLKAEEPFTPETLDKATNGCQPRDPDSAFSQFNVKHGNPKAMLELLKRHGYLLKNISQINDEISYRLLSPHSKSGNAGIVLFSGDEGTWRVYSHHGADDPLSKNGTNKTCDAFDLSRILEHDGQELAALEAWQRESDARPVIRIVGGEIAPNLTAAVDALAKTNPPVVYQRGQSLCRVAHLDEDTEAEGCSIPKGTGQILVVHRAVLAVELSKAIRWEKHKKSGWHQANPCPQVTSALLEGVGMWDGIPCLIGLSEAPILRDDGSLLAEPGYDDKTRLYVEGRFPVMTLPDQVTKEQAQEAAKTLIVPFEEFPFVDPQLDSAVLLAYLMTLAVRAQLTTAPLFCISATTPGTGKGLLVEAANLLVRGRDAATMPPLQGSGGEDEMRKRISMALLHGLASANFDNCSKALGGDALNTMLTTSNWVDRGLGTLNSLNLPNRITLAATGNNLAVRGDTTRRSVVLQLDAKAERPELRSFKEKDLPAYILRNRGELLTALFTIFKGFQQAGSPGAHDSMLGRFEPWSAAVCAPIRWLGYPDPIESQARLRELDPEDEKLGVLLAVLWDLLGTKWLQVGDIIKAADDYYTCDADRAKKDALQTALREIAAEGRDQVNNRLLGWFLRHHEGRIIDGYRLERKPRPDTKSKKPQQYRVTNDSAPDV